jgi:16S rRNA (guanine527-N7)-methyltransferase
VNLVAPNTLNAVWQRHFADSAQLLRLAPKAEAWLDLGSGGGFPGMVIAILLANRARTRVHLVESNARKCAFLGEVARATGAMVEIHNMRVESLGRSATVETPDVITARALSPLPKLLSQAAPFFGKQTRGLFPKGRAAEQELETARMQYAMQAVLHPSRTEADGRIVEITRLRKRESP